jgi:hypothetical protein
VLVLVLLLRQRWMLVLMMPLLLLLLVRLRVGQRMMILRLLLLLRLGAMCMPRCSSDSVPCCCLGPLLAVAATSAPPCSVRGSTAVPCCCSCCMCCSTLLQPLRLWVEVFVFILLILIPKLPELRPLCARAQRCGMAA